MPKHKYYLRQNPAKEQIYTSMLNVSPTPFEEQGNEQRNYLQALAILGACKVNVKDPTHKIMLYNDSLSLK